MGKKLACPTRCYVSITAEPGVMNTHNYCRVNWPRNKSWSNTFIFCTKARWNTDEFCIVKVGGVGEWGELKWKCWNHWRENQINKQRRQDESVRTAWKEGWRRDEREAREMQHDGQSEWKRGVGNKEPHTIMEKNEQRNGGCQTKTSFRETRLK